jgi:hypothetical protein
MSAGSTRMNIALEFAQITNILCFTRLHPTFSNDCDESN